MLILWFLVYIRDVLYLACPVSFYSSVNFRNVMSILCFLLYVNSVYHSACLVTFYLSVGILNWRSILWVLLKMYFEFVRSLYYLSVCVRNEMSILWVLSNMDSVFFTAWPVIFSSIWRFSKQNVDHVGSYVHEERLFSNLSGLILIC